MGGTAHKRERARHQELKIGFEIGSSIRNDEGAKDEERKRSCPEGESVREVEVQSSTAPSCLKIRLP